MDSKYRTEIALFRFSVIGPLVNTELGWGELQKKMKKLSSLTYTIPYSQRRTVGFGTISEWLHKYKKHSFEGLYPKTRMDKGKSRMDSDTLEKISDAKKKNPRRPILLIIRDLKQKRQIQDTCLPLSSVYRALEVSKLKQPVQKKDQKRYEHKHSNDMWQSDVMYGPYIPHKEGQKPKRTYLIDIIDDASRLIIGAKFYPLQNLLYLKDIFRQGVMTYGIPTKLFVDNGKIYRSQELEIACAKLHTALIYSTPYYPAGKGKVEKFHKRVREQFLTSVSNINSLEEFNEKFEHWLQNDYNRSPHQGIENKTPLNKYLERLSHIRRFPGNVYPDELFYREEKRQVGKDATFRINNILYEAPEHLIGEKIQVLFDCDNMEKVKIRFGEKDEGYCIPIDYLANSKIKRKKFEDKEDHDDPGCILS